MHNLKRTDVCQIKKPETSIMSTEASPQLSRDNRFLNAGALDAARQDNQNPLQSIKDATDAIAQLQEIIQMAENKRNNLKPKVSIGYFI
jgi:hypothetical protein